jgi:predicted MFS family arabinose efflux permease
MIIMPLGDIFIEEFNLNAQEYSLLVSSYAISAAVSSIIGIFLIDKFDRKNALLVLYTGFTIGTLICGFCDNYVSLLLARLFTGFFGGLIGALVLSVISDLFLFNERGKAMGYLFAAFSAASAFGVPIGIYLAAISDWQLPFWAIGGIGILIVILIFFTFPSMNAHKNVVPQHINLTSITRDIFKEPNQRNALIAGFVLIMAHFMIIPFISPFLIKNIGFTQKQISLQFFLGGVATLFTSPFIGKLTDKIGVMKVFIVVMLISFIPTIVITNLSPPASGSPNIPLVLVFTTMFFIFASGRMIAPNAIITASAPTKTRGSFMALKSALQQFAIALTGVISGMIVFIGKDGLYQNYHFIGYLSVFFGVIALFVVNKLKVAEGN